MSIKPLFLSLLVSLNLINYDTGDYVNMAQNPIILDMDFCTDVDDAVAVRMATTLDDMNVCTLVAAGLSTTSNDGSDINVRALHGLLTYDGYESVPIGKAHITEPDTSPYWEVCASYSRSDPGDVDAVELYKEVLKCSYNKVTIVTTGYLTNIEYLLKDPDGMSLIKDKCERIVVTGGTYPNGRDNNFSYTANAAKAVKYVEENCPVQIIYVPNDVGGAYTAGGLIQQLSSEDLLSKALSAFGTQDGRAAWDPTAVFIAAVPDDVSNFDYVPVSVEFGADGSHTFKESSNSAIILEDTGDMPDKDIRYKDEDGTEDINKDNTVRSYDVSGYADTVSKFTNTVSGNNVADSDIPIVGPEDSDGMRVASIGGENLSKSNESSLVRNSNLSSLRFVVRRKSSVSVKQYKDMIDGVISYKYLK